MVDIWVGNELFKGIGEDIEVMMVGDEDEVGCVGGGEVLRELVG